jgi:hypothetical protein
MNVRTVIATVGVAALITGGTVALAFPAAASPRSTKHTLKFISETKQNLTWSSSALAQQDNDLNSKGKVIGFDELNIAFDLKDAKGTAYVAVDLKGGILYGKIGLSQSSPDMKGVVTGGVGIFKSASGTITSKPANAAATKYAVTITYRT